MNIIVNSRFNPFTYEELVKPLEDYTKAYKEVEAQYSDLLQQTEAFRNIANQQINPDAYNMFNKYATDLNAVIDDFSKGMTIANRRPLLGLKGRYYREIKPIADAEKALNAEVALRREETAKDDSIKYRDNDLRLDRFLNGQTVSNERVSGRQIAAEVGAEVEALSKALFSDPEFEEVLGGQKIKVTQLNGMTPRQLGYVIGNTLNDPRISNDLRNKLQSIRNVYDRVISKYEGWGDEIEDYVKDRATLGMYAGLAKPTIDLASNEEYISKADRQSYNLAKGRFDWEKGRYEEQDRINKIKEGQAPYSYEPNGDGTYTARYSNDDLMWSQKVEGTIDKNGNLNITKVISSTIPKALPAKDRGRSSSSEDVVKQVEKQTKYIEQLMPLIGHTWETGNNNADDVNDKDKTAYDIYRDYDGTLTTDELGPNTRTLLENRIDEFNKLNGTKLTIDDFEVRWLDESGDDLYWIVPKPHIGGEGGVVEDSQSKGANI